MLMFLLGRQLEAQKHDSWQSWLWADTKTPGWSWPLPKRHVTYPHMGTWEIMKNTQQWCGSTNLPKGLLKLKLCFHLFWFDVFFVHGLPRPSDLSSCYSKATNMWSLVTHLWECWLTLRSLRDFSLNRGALLREVWKILHLHVEKCPNLLEGIRPSRRPLDFVSPEVRGRRGKKSEPQINLKMGETGRIWGALSVWKLYVRELHMYITHIWNYIHQSPDVVFKVAVKDPTKGVQLNNQIWNSC